MQEQKDEKLWRIARERAAFRKNLFSYLVVNLFLWAIWWFTTGSEYLNDRRGIPWPCWVMLGWGLGIAFHYFRAYQGSKADITEQEYERLKQQQKL